jgi:hypothetical protein
MKATSVNILFPAYVTHELEGKECECLVFLDIANKKVYLAHSWNEYNGDSQSIFDNLTQQRQGLVAQTFADVKAKFKEINLNGRES